MNYITTYWVKGISRIDTPIFDSLVDQEHFFSESESYTIPNNSFYPPHFKNRILLNTSDINFKSQRNYLSLEYGSKTYYYFIDSIEYVSEDVIALNITMDVIQTFMFSINIISAEKERESIKRWINNKINRDYIRENVSSGDFMLKYKTKVLPSSMKNELDDSQTGISGWIIAKEPPSAFETDSLVYVRLDNKTLFTGFEYHLFPLITGNVTEIKLTNSGNIDAQGQIVDPSGVVTRSYDSIYKNLYTETDMQSIYYIPGNPFVDAFYTKTFPGYGLVIVYDDNVIKYQAAKCFTPNGLYDYEDLYYLDVAPIAREEYIGEFSKNTATERPFNWAYCPQLLDSNYYRLEWGEQSNDKALYPSERITEIADPIRLSLYSDFMAGSRMYSIHAVDDLNYYGQPSYNANEFDSSAYLNNPITFDLMSVAWRDYVAYNSMSIVTSIVGKVVSAVAGGATMAAGMGVSGMSMEEATSMYKAMSGWSDDITPYSAAENSEMRRVLSSGEGSESLSEPPNMSSGNSKPLVALGNAIFAPSSGKVNGNATYQYFINNFSPDYSIYYVRDMEQCAEYFESYGYLVNVHIHDKTLQDFNNRYYYDVIKLANIKLDIADQIATTQLKLKITERLTAGLRLWHSDYDVLRIEDDGHFMSQVCIYDNVEV